MLKIVKITLGIFSLFLLFIALLAGYILIDWTPVQAENADKDELVINDITQLNPIRVANVIRPKTAQEIAQMITSSSGKISIGGGRYSQGGQVALPDSIHFDMRGYNQVVNLDVDKKQITVQSGITWRDLQAFIDPHNLSVRIMQSYANFTVGGSLSVNVHGRYIGEGPIVRSVLSLQIVLANGSIINASPIEKPNIFYAAIGGYGGLGVITEVTLSLVENVKVARQTQTMHRSEYASFFIQAVASNDQVVFHNADLYPPDFKDVRAVSWLKSEAPLTNEQRLIPKNTDYTWQPKVAEFVADSNFGKWMRQHVFEPVLYQFDIVQWRNYEASYDVRELEPKSRADYTYALREYFVPVDEFDNFSQAMKRVFIEHQVNVINVSIRHALPDSGTLLAWAPQEVFAFVVYYRQGTSQVAKQKVAQWSREMIDEALKLGGSYYLPYQLNASTHQFLQAYPNAPLFFELKKKLDPNNRFSNSLWEQHYLPD